MQTTQVEIWIIVDAAGDTAIGADEDEASQAYAENIGGDSATRRIKITLTVPLPKAIELTATVPEEPSEGKIEVQS